MSALPVYNRLGSILEYADYLKFQNQSRVDRSESILVCEHPPTLTLGVQYNSENLLSSPDVLKKAAVTTFAIGRGGDITAHEPGQMIFYVHADLRKRNIHLTDFFSNLLASVQYALGAAFGLDAENIPDMPGLYVRGEKIASIGVEFRSFFTGHGIAINVSNDLSTFAHIHPCGQAGLKINSVSRLLSGKVTTLQRDLFIDLILMRIQGSLLKTL